MRYLCTVVLGMALAACNPPSKNNSERDPNPPAEGFRMEVSDPRAVALADSVMLAMGGRSAWDRTRYLGWNFFGFRYLVWDKQEGRVRIDSPRDSLRYLVDLSDESRGKVFRQGVPVEDPQERDSLLRRGESIWINDSYWLVMPFKLKDSGVALQYLGQDRMQRGGLAEQIALTFEGVGDTPRNKYVVSINPDTYLVEEWAFYRDQGDAEPAIVTPWGNYRRHGGILLSGDRGERQLTDIRVWQQLPDSVFTKGTSWSPR